MRQSKTEIAGYWGAPERGARAEMIVGVIDSYNQCLSTYDRLMSVTPASLRACRAIGTVWGAHFGARGIAAGPLRDHIEALAIAGLRGTGTGRETRADDATRDNSVAPARGREMTTHCQRWGSYAPRRVAMYNAWIWRGRAHWSYVRADGITITRSRRIVRGQVVEAGKLLRIDPAPAIWYDHAEVLQAMRRRGLCDWGRDADGIYMSLSGDRYHLQGIRTQSGRDYQVALDALRGRIAEARQMARNRELDAELNLHGYSVMVSVSDSTASGNCPTGTQRFCEDIARFFAGWTPDVLPADTLLALRDDNFTRRACRVAALRNN